MQHLQLQGHLKDMSDSLKIAVIETAEKTHKKLENKNIKESCSSWGTICGIVPQCLCRTLARQSDTSHRNATWQTEDAD